LAAAARSLAASRRCSCRYFSSSGGRADGITWAGLTGTPSGVNTTWPADSGDFSPTALSSPTAFGFAFAGAFGFALGGAFGFGVGFKPGFTAGLISTGGGGCGNK